MCLYYCVNQYDEFFFAASTKWENRLFLKLRILEKTVCTIEFSAQIYIIIIRFHTKKVGICFNLPGPVRLLILAKNWSNPTSWIARNAYHSGSEAVNKNYSVFKSIKKLACTEIFSEAYPTGYMMYTTSIWMCAMETLATYQYCIEF